MKKILLALLVAIQLLFVCGCSMMQTDNRIRISGIVSACKQAPQLRQNYLQQKVNNDEISQLVAFTIQECLKNEQ